MDPSTSFYQCLMRKKDALAAYRRGGLVDETRLKTVRGRLAAAKTTEDCEAVFVTDALARSPSGCYTVPGSGIMCDL
jgi:hypothetical protein